MKNHKPTCPYCGAIMQLCVDAYSNDSVAGVYYECLVCKAGSPYIEDDAADDIKAAALFAAMQRYVEPTEKVIRTCATCASYRPSEFTNRVFCAYHSEDGHDHEIYADDYCSYWERRPTDEGGEKNATDGQAD